MTDRKVFEVDLAALESEVRRIAHENPDKVVNCTYTTKERDAPECIFGHALHALGIPISDLAAWDDTSSNAPGDTNLIYEVVEGIEHDSWFFRVQDIQDADQPWGDAVRFADSGGDWWTLDNDDGEE